MYLGRSRGKTKHACTKKPKQANNQGKAERVRKEFGFKIVWIRQCALQETNLGLTQSSIDKIKCEGCRRNLVLIMLIFQMHKDINHQWKLTYQASSSLKEVWCTFIEKITVLRQEPGVNFLFLLSVHKMRHLVSFWRHRNCLFKNKKNECIFIALQEIMD